VTTIDWVWTTVATVNFVGACVCGALWALIERVVPRLSDVVPGDRSGWPRVSIVVAARNEERNIEEGVRSLLGLDYPDLQITVVNDRSTDQTAAILGRIALENPRLNVVSIEQLPAGWLGKNNAMHVGAFRSDGEWVLFTDADIIFAPDTLRKAIAYSEAHGVDHLAAAPRVITPSFWLRAFVPVFSMFFVLYVKAWAIRNRNDRSAWVGVGAFNLVRGTAYRAIGGHEKLRLRPDDDVRLGKQLKEAGFQADFVGATEELSVEWYSSVGELIRGLEKNAFAASDYRCTAALAANAFLLGGFVLPFVAMFVAPWPANLLSGLAAGIAVFFAGRACRSNGQPGILGLLFPVGVLLFAMIQIRTMILNLWQGGIRWRDTFYSLEELRRNVT
jgi:cellulose synthase/poly-beta-1,6-N-acetylglucosamine synthase-like glycosyltransferase